MAERSQAAAVAALRRAGLRGYSLHAFRQMWAQTGNDVELAAASAPGVVLWSEENARQYHPVEAS